MDPLKVETKRRRSGFRRIIRTVVLLALLAVVIIVALRYFFVFGEGVKAGQLNFIVKKGFVFKTFEGRMILSGYRSNVPGSIQSNEFEFSVVEERIANQLMSNSGAFFELHYKEYLGSLPWRGMSKYIVDSIISIHKGSEALPNVVR